ncbi:antibiotic biosynthesis monooxygenase [Clostridium carboxidivorans P7]|uniref:Antibiotic biosynthesis monooxygenase n=1 Tax=Clostridium carboxidivorans P7 TaxID=536227 RepID=C6PRT6_9CLOT|nr:putative quinol monooxygenase [Clostridium carboxidivorans]AKN30053.1 antibiotic biosynthesis monooxygenase [Clostridium carboxidivorans P7]EET87988.1 Antibiotic biosynthesis monooxygenase [Clostridium carboxidivorans P7]EFG89058.1 antibiotic biosynthesis monooxygenase [Clostridium carboxidivorans P7]
MIVKSVTLYVNKKHIEEFIEATKENQNNSLKEAGIIGFDFFRCKDDSSKFLLYEVYKSEDDVNKHMETDHFKKWISTVEKWFSKPRDRATYIPVS